MGEMEEEYNQVIKQMRAAYVAVRKGADVAGLAPAWRAGVSLYSRINLDLPSLPIEEVGRFQGMVVHLGVALDCLEELIGGYPVDQAA